MTLSREDRSANASEALSRMLASLGNQVIDGRYFYDNDVAFMGVYPTTRKELVDKGYVSVRRIGANDIYQLTGLGWFAAANVHGLLNDPAFERKIGGLCAVLKALLVKGRQDPAIVGLDELANRAGLERNWIFNVIEANVLEEHFKKQGAHWVAGGLASGPRHVKVPIDFDLPLA